MKTFNDYKNYVRREQSKVETKKIAALPSFRGMILSSWPEPHLESGGYERPDDSYETYDNVTDDEPCEIYRFGELNKRSRGIRLT